MLHPIDVIRNILVTLMIGVSLLAVSGYWFASDTLLFYAEFLFYVMAIISSLPLLFLMFPFKRNDEVSS